MDNNENSKANPPYLSVSRLEKLIELLSTRNFNEITLAYLRSQGLGGTDANLGIGALKFLGIVDDKGKVNPDTAKGLQLKGDPRVKALENIVRSGYAALFEATAEPYNLDKDDLTNEFIYRYGLTPRVARTAVPAFLYLSEKAGLREESIVVPKRTQNGTKPKAASRAAEKTPLIETSDPSKIDFPFMNKRVHFSFPKDERFTSIVLSPEFKAVSDAIESFGSRFFAGTQVSEDNGEAE